MASRLGPAQPRAVTWNGARLAHLLARPAGELLAHMLDDLPTARDHLQGFGDVLAQLAQPRTAAALAVAGRGLDHTLARQMSGKRLARRALAGKRRHIRGARGRLLGGDLVRGGRALQLSERQGQLVKQPHGALRTLAIELVAQLGDLPLLLRYHGLIVGGAGLGDRQLCLGLERPR